MAVALDGNFSAGLDYSAKHGMAAVSANFLQPKEPIKLKLLGEYRRGASSDEIVPAIQVRAGTALITVLLGQLPAFMAPTLKPPGQAR